MTTTDKALKFAVENNNQDLFNWALTQGKPTNFNECLLLAIQKDAKEMVNILLEKIGGTDKVPMGPRPLVVVDAIYLNMSKNTLKVGQNSKFMITLHTNPEQALKELVEGVISKEEINHRNEKGWTALMYLCRNANLIPLSDKLIQKLMDLEADVNLVEEAGWTALMLAASHTKKDSSEETVEMLLKHPKIEINAVDKDGDPAIMLVALYLSGPCISSTEKTFEMLLNSPKIDLNIKAKNSATILIILAKYGNMKLVECLLATGKAKLDILDNYLAYYQLGHDYRQKLFALVKKMGVKID